MYLNGSIAALGAVFGGYDGDILSKLTEEQLTELAVVRSQIEQNKETERHWGQEWERVKGDAQYAPVLKQLSLRQVARSAAPIGGTPEEVVRRAGFEVRETSYDGSCGFEALVQQLPLKEDGKRWTRQELRALLAQFLHDAAQKADREEADRLRKRAEAVAREGEWMRDDDVPCLANHFDVDVIVVYEDPSNHQVVAQRIAGSQGGCDYDVEPIAQDEGLDLAESLRENAAIPAWDGRMPLVIVNRGNNHWLATARRVQAVD